MFKPVCYSLCFLLIAGIVSADEKPAKTKIDFVKDVEPILAKHCYDCHGPDEAEGRLRLDAKKIVFKGGINGPSIIRGKSDKSLLYKRIVSDELGDQMPVDADPLSDAETKLIRDWIDQRAPWPDEVGAQVASLEKHWSYLVPERPDYPKLKNPGWVRNAIDAFVLARLEKEGLGPSPEAEKVKLLRRVTLDLIGVPPTLDEVDTFLADESPNAYMKVVDRLLASPKYGERWAIPWLDAARYADSNGYQRDGRREFWAYRDWVVHALNDDMGFDQFTIEQIAGDLLLNATKDQQIATGFHRGTMANVEAGTDPDEEYFLATIDRVNTTGTVWLGTSLECGQCHSHKYDPITQKEYYQIYAFFNNTEKEIQSVGSRRDFIGPKVALDLSPKLEKERSRLKIQLEALKKENQQLTKSLKAKQPLWETELAKGKNQSGWKVLEPVKHESLEGAALKKRDDNSLLAVGNRPGTDIYEVVAKTDQKKMTAFRVEIMTDPSLPGGGPGRAKPGNFILSEFKVEAAPADKPEAFQKVELVETIADYSQKNWPVKNAIDGNRKTGWAVGGQFGQGHHAVFVAKSRVGFEKGTVLRFTLDQQYGNGRTIGCFQLMATSGSPGMLGVPENIRKLASTVTKKRNAKQKKQLGDFFLSQSKGYKELQARVKKVQSDYDKIQPPTSLVMQELEKPRVTRMFQRGDFLKPTEEVKPGTPASLNPFPKGAPNNRLGLAQWLVDRQNPLVARVTMNRHWLEFFGRGIVESIEEFGSQGDPPSHPELLDWLAVEFMEKDWSFKTIHRLIVTSATYRQSSNVSPELLERDPYNMLYARGPRFRIRAEYIRDNALAIAGLLADKMYGPPVFPVQPDGVWNHIGVASNAWKTSSGLDMHRRGLYVYWRRTVPYPSFMNFDAPSREACTVKRSLSSTPLQALTLMNDPAYFEAAVALSGRMVTEIKKDASPAERVEYGFRLATSRRPNSLEVEILVKRYESELARYKKNKKAVDQLLEKWKVPAGVDRAEFAAWVHVANILFNLDEVITKG